MNKNDIRLLTCDNLYLRLIILFSVTMEMICRFHKQNLNYQWKQHRFGILILLLTSVTEVKA